MSNGSAGSAPGRSSSVAWSSFGLEIVRFIDIDHDPAAQAEDTRRPGPPPHQGSQRVFSAAGTRRFGAGTSAATPMWMHATIR